MTQRRNLNFDLNKGYKPEKYFREITPKLSTYNKVQEVTIGSALGATVPIQLEQVNCNALVDTGATRSCISECFYQKLGQPQIRTLYQIASSFCFRWKC